MSDRPLRRDAAFLDVVRLCLIGGVGPRTRHALLSHFGTATSVLQASQRELCQVSGVGPQVASRITAARQAIDVQDELDVCEAAGLNVITSSDELYPRLLQEIHDPPGLLFMRGDLLARDQLAIGIVGTRHATPYGKRMAERLGGGLARAGLTIVSGLARGIDAAAHQAALQAGGRTLAILGSGLLSIYPPEHVGLAVDIARQGACISELPPRRQPMSGTFPQRNRLISGLSLGVIVVEAGQRSGALITAGHAAEQGREVFAVPGPADSRMSRGCHELLGDGARLVTCVDDVLEELGPLVDEVEQDGHQVKHPAELTLNDQERAILDAMGSEPISIDEVVQATHLPVARVLATFSVLEMRRLVERLGGQQIRRK